MKVSQTIPFEHPENLYSELYEPRDQGNEDDHDNHNQKKKQAFFHYASRILSNKNTFIFKVLFKVFFHLDAATENTYAFIQKMVSPRIKYSLNRI